MDGEDLVHKHVGASFTPALSRVHPPGGRIRTRTERERQLPDQSEPGAAASDLQLRWLERSSSFQELSRS